MSSDRFYNLLPVVYRQRDLEEGSPLQMLLRVIAEQVDLVEENIGQLYDNWFIETCEDWVVPYIGDLVGYQPVHRSEENRVTAGSAADISVPRREVANTIRFRRRKGTLALLEELAFAVAGWPALAVEFSRYLSGTQNLQHLRTRSGNVLDLRDVNGLDLLGGAFDRLSHVIDLSGITSVHAEGKYNLPSLGVFVCRLNVYPSTRSVAYCLEEIGAHCFTFSTLGNDTSLFNKADRSLAAKGLRELSLPVPIRRRAFQQQQGDTVHASRQYYGEDKSVAVWAPDWAGTDPKQPIPAEKVISADLSEWKYRPKPGHIAIDPELGRIAFPPGQLPAKGVFVSYHYGFSWTVGGGEYARPVIVSSLHSTTYSVGAGREFSTVRAAYEQYRKEKPAPANAIIEITESRVYEEQLHIEIAEDCTLEVRAANGARPIIRQLDWHASRPDTLQITGARGSSLVLDGLLISGRGIEVKGELRRFVIRHCTLVPGWALQPDGHPRRAKEPSVAIANTIRQMLVDHSILGPINVIREDGDIDPVAMTIKDSIVDPTHTDAAAVGAPEGQTAPVALTLLRSTVMGRLSVHSIALAENSIVMGHTIVVRRQVGCMRFCFIHPGSRTPKRFQCQPDLVEEGVAHRARREHLPPEETNALQQRERLRVEPEFMSTRYGDPNYCRLAESCAPEIMNGAADESELGVFHSLFHPQREANLRIRLEEFVPAGIDVAILFAT